MVLPCDKRAADILGNHAVPFYFGAPRSLSDPLRVVIVNRAHRHQIIHNARQIFKVSPEAVKFRRRAIDRYRAFDTDQSILGF